jgi:hypothetical protein
MKGDDVPLIGNWWKQLPKTPNATLVNWLQ